MPAAVGARAKVDTDEAAARDAQLREQLDAFQQAERKLVQRLTEAEALAMAQAQTIADAGAHGEECSEMGKADGAAHDQTKPRPAAGDVLHNVLESIEQAGRDLIKDNQALRARGRRWRQRRMCGAREP